MDWPEVLCVWSVLKSTPGHNGDNVIVRRALGFLCQQIALYNLATIASLSVVKEFVTGSGLMGRHLQHFNNL